jgi:hypothetical protein
LVTGITPRIDGLLRLLPGCFLQEINMRHLTPLTRKPAVAQDITIGGILSLIATLMGEIGTFLIAKETAQLEGEAAAAATLAGLYGGAGTTTQS